MTQEFKSRADVLAPPQLTGIHHIGITVSDVERSMNWYGKVLGMTEVFREDHHDSNEGGFAVILGNEAGNFNIGIDHHPANDGSTFTPTRNGLDHFCFPVGTRADLEAWSEHLNDQGVEHPGIVDIEGMPMAVLNFKDPDGIAIEFISIN